MKIVSPFREYYDSVQAHVQDERPVYVRRTQEFDCRGDNASIRRLKEIVWPIQSRIIEAPNFKFTDRQAKLFSGLGKPAGIAFCGRFYPAYIVNQQHCYNYQRVIEEYQRREDAKQAQEAAEGRHYRNNAKEEIKLLEEAIYKPRRPTDNYPALTKASWVAYQADGPFLLPPDMFRALNTPVIYVDEYKIVLNPNLRHLNFAAVVDPYQAYQQIDFFLGNELATVGDVPAPMTDELKVHSHGFNEWSFRRHATEDSKYQKKQRKGK